MDDRIKYLNTDLDLESEADLTDLAAAFESGCCDSPNVTRGDDGIWYATIERFLEENEEPEQTIASMLDCIEAFDAKRRRAWEECRTREFNIGYDCGIEPWAFNQGLSNELLRRIAACGASVRITLYPSEEHAGCSIGGAEAPPRGAEPSLEIDVSTVATKADLHELLARALGFPDDYGRNWDAFWDCIRDPAQSKMPATLRITGWFALREKLPLEARRLRECLTDLPVERPEMTVEVAGPGE